MLENCNLCAHNCNINRNNVPGYCKCGISPKLALVSTHNWEEPCISKGNGSGTIFFSGCNMRCIFCQNHEITHENFGKEIQIERLAQIFLEQQNRNVNNINLVSPTPYVPQIVEAIKLAKESGLHIPIIYNTNSYENIDTIKMLKGYIDVYLPDLKYYTNETAIKYSNAPNYFEVATKSILEMINQVGLPSFNKNGTIQKGVIIRHLVLPSHLMETKHILEWIKANLPQEIYISIMLQYFPTYKAKEDTLINRKISQKEYELVQKWAMQIPNGYIQELRQSRRRICSKV